MIPKGKERIGPYPVVRILGAGGMGVVYEVRDPVLPRTLALKLIKQNLASANARERFLREASVLAKIQHPNVVKVHKLGKTHEGPYIVEELIPGRPLSEAMDDDLPFELVARVTRDLARALGAVHAQGILHRDLKPGNVILRENGSPVLLDFGLAREVDAETLTKTGQPLGTPAYMSPEQARGTTSSALTPATDVYGLGAILYSLLTRGATPFEGHAMHVIFQILNAEAPAPASHGRDVPPALEAICQVAMTRDPTQRYASMRALEEDLDRFLAGERTQAEARLGRERKQTLGKRAALSAIALLALGAAALGAVALQSLPQTDASTPETPAPNGATATKPEAEVTPPLWSLTPGDSLAFVARYSEDDTLMIMKIECWIQGNVEEVQDGRARVNCRIARVRSSFGNAMIGAGNDYDTQTAKEQKGHPLSAMRIAKDRLFEMTVDCQTGQVIDVSGIDATGQAIVELHKGHSIGKDMPDGMSLMFNDRLFEGVFGRAFSDAFIKTMLNSIFRGRSDPAGKLVWLEPIGREGEDQRVLAGGEPRAYLLRPLSPSYSRSKRHAFQFTGTTTFRAGRLTVGEVEQRLVSKTHLPKTGSVPVSSWQVTFEQ